MNDKQKAFIEEYLINGMNATDAYLKAYPKSKYDTARANGAKLLANANIQDYINNKQKITAERNEVTKADIIRVLVNIMNDTTARNNDKIKSCEVLLKALGYNEPEKLISSITTSTNLKDLFDFNED